MFREDKDVVMQRVNEYRFYELGQKIAAIQEVDQNTQYANIWYSLWEAREALKQLKTDAIAMRISIPVVDRLINAVTAIVPIDLRLATEKVKPLAADTPVLIGWSYWELSDALRQFEPVLAAECNALDTYVVSQKRGYATSDLVDRADLMLPQETRDILLASVLADVKAAGRCLALDTPTAAGFHMIRATDAVMGLYYKHVTGRELTKRNRNWGAYLKKLGEAPSAERKIIGALEHIKDNYRNPVLHPEDTLTEGAAIMLFGLSLSVIELMAEQIRSTAPTLTPAEELKAVSEIAASELPDDF